MFRFLFKICTHFLLNFGRLFHFSYEKVSVVINLYLQGFMLMISGVLPLVASGGVVLSNPSTFNIALCILMTIYASIYVTLWIMMLKHYPPRWEDTFDLCVKDLLKICDCLHISYVMLNLIIFVVWWLALISVNVLLSYFILS